ncbi:MAG: HisA/HisF-related TIM barrel protein [Pirellulales bacterium]
MKILPVIDLCGGFVVRGVAGKRAAYRPVESLLAEDARPASVARAFATDFPFDEVYVADLDAIEGREPSWEVYRTIAARGLRVWLDAGIRTPRQGAVLIRFLGEADGVRGLVVGLETGAGGGAMAGLVEAIGPERTIFSLDLFEGAAWRARSDWHRQAPAKILDDALQAGVRRFLVLDLARVGAGQGVGTESICHDLRRKSPTVWIAAGGGIRGAEDVRSIARAGCDAVLVASALHDGRLTAEACRRLSQTR